MATKSAGTYGKLVKSLMGPLPEVYGTNAVQRLIGFHIIWHMMGGDEPMKKAGWGDVTLWRAHKEFRKAFGTTVEDGFPELAAVARTMGGRDVD